MNEPSMSSARRLALRVTVGVALATGLSTVSGLGALTLPLGVLTGLCALWFGWLSWDESRGRTHRTGRTLDAWVAATGGLRDGDSLAFQLDGGRPATLRAAMTRSGVMAVALLTPLQTATFSFRAWPASVPRPGFDGQEPSVGGPRTDPLPGVEAIVASVRAELGHDAASPPLRVEGNAPERILQLLTPRLLRSLHDTERLHGGDFRGITFDGAQLGIHWLGPTAGDPLTALHASSGLLVALLPEVPSPVPSPALLH